MLWGKEQAERGGVIKEVAREGRSLLMSTNKTPSPLWAMLLDTIQWKTSCQTQAASPLGFPGSVFLLSRLLGSET